jgi:hypothetical protein
MDRIATLLLQTAAGCNLHGLYDPDTSPGMITRDFLQFCKLAVKAGVLPRPWDWALFLNKARGLLPYAFEKSDAKEKWGRENVFAAGEVGGTIQHMVLTLCCSWLSCARRSSRCPMLQQL